MPINRKDIRVKFSADVDQFGRGVRKATSDLDRFERKATVSANKLKGAFRGFGAGLAGILGGISVTAGLTAVVRTTAEFEKLNASLIAVTGSREKASKAFAEIETFARDTPFQLQEVVTAFTKLTALGLEPSMDALRSYGNTASALGKDLDQFIEAIADAVTGEFERLKEFGIKARKEGEQVSFVFQGVTTTVRNSSIEIEKYLRDIGNIQFADAMSLQMDTLGGKLSNLSGAVARFGRTLGDSVLGDAIKSVTDGLIGLTNAATDAVQALSGPTLKELQGRLNLLEAGPTGGRSGRVNRARRIRNIREQIEEQLSEIEGPEGIRNRLKNVEDTIAEARERITKLTADIAEIPQDQRRASIGIGRSKRDTVFGRLNKDLKQANEQLASLTLERQALFDQLVKEEFARAEGDAKTPAQAAQAAATSLTSSRRDLPTLRFPDRQQVKEAKDPIDEFVDSLYRYREELELVNPKLERLGVLFSQGAIPVEVYKEGIRRLGFETEATLDKVTAEIEKTDDAFQELGLTFTSAFEDAIVNGAKLSDVLRGLEQDIIRIITRKLVTEPIGNAVSGAFSEGGIFGDLLGGLFGPLFGGGQALGGPVMAGNAYVVGERGPELFVPNRSGNIARNDQIGGTVNVYVSPPAGASPDAYRLSARQGALEGSRLLSRARAIT